jgi:UDP-N-acetylmuramate dehydrogenase
MTKIMGPVELKYLRSEYGKKLREGILMSTCTSARVGGPSDVSIITRTKNELASISTDMWEKGIPFMIIGGGSNLLVSDKGIRELVIFNKAKSIHFDENPDKPQLEAESGTTLNYLSQKAAGLGLSGLEWAATVPGTLGGAVYGNAGAFGGDLAGNLVSVLINFPDVGTQEWNVDKFKYEYRSSILKRDHLDAVILSACLSVSKSSPENVRQKMMENSKKRHETQPKGATMGSTFKNPPGDYSGRLLEGAGMKGIGVGNAEFSSKHANFIINHGKTKAEDIKALIDLARQKVAEKFDIQLELEIELVGEW